MQGHIRGKKERGSKDCSMRENMEKYEFDMQKKCLLDQTELFVIDMDGTFYCGERLIDGALDFLKALEKRGKAFSVFYK